MLTAKTKKKKISNQIQPFMLHHWKANLFCTSKFSKMILSLNLLIVSLAEIH